MPKNAERRKRSMKNKVAELAKRIEKNGGIVADQVCIDLWDLMNDCMEKELQRKIYTIWKSSKCSNGDLVQMALEMLAATLPEDQPLTPAEKRTRDVCAAAQIQINEERNQKGEQPKFGAAAKRGDTIKGKIGKGRPAAIELEPKI
jgi:hypothetical protein